MTYVEKKKIAKDTSKVELGFEMVLAMEGRKVRSTLERKQGFVSLDYVPSNLIL